MIPSEVTTALQDVSRAFSEVLPRSEAAKPRDTDEVAAKASEDAAEAAAEAVAAAADSADVLLPGSTVPVQPASR